MYTSQFGIGYIEEKNLSWEFGTKLIIRDTAWIHNTRATTKPLAENLIINFKLVIPQVSEGTDVNPT